jgi:histone acetyltransferase (RNA polymerase elongator complex component)
VDTEKAFALLKALRYEIGAQLMVGLPGDDEIIAMKSARRTALLGPQFVRIYPAIVLKNSLLAKWYTQGNYAPLSLDRSVELVKKLYLYFAEQKIAVVRMGLQSERSFDTEKAILAGPYHPAFGHLVYSRLFLDAAAQILGSHKSFANRISLRVHPRSVPKMRGFKNGNLAELKKKFQIAAIDIVPDPALSENAVHLVR